MPIIGQFPGGSGGNNAAFDELNEVLDELSTTVTTHINSESNPHSTTLSQIGVIFSTEPLIPGESELMPGQLYFVYE